MFDTCDKCVGGKYFDVEAHSCILLPVLEIEPIVIEEEEIETIVQVAPPAIHEELIDLIAQVASIEAPHPHPHPHSCSKGTYSSENQCLKCPLNCESCHDGWSCDKCIG